MSSPLGIAVSGGPRPSEIIELVVLAESLGYDSAWIAEGHGGDQFSVLSGCALQTSRIRLGTAISSVFVRSIPTIAMAAATVDDLSHGRFILGVGLGAYREEFTAMSPRLADAHRGDMLDEAIEAFLTLIGDPGVSFDGAHYAFKNIEMMPKPKQDPFPLYIGGHSLGAVERAARWGQGWLSGWRPFAELEERIRLLKRRAAEHGRADDAVEIAPQFSMLLARTDAEAEAKYMASGLVAHRLSLNYTGRNLDHQVTANLVGSPATVIEKIAKLREMGVDHCSALMIPVDTVAEMNEQIEWFATDIMPNFPAALHGKSSPIPT